MNLRSAEVPVTTVPIYMHLQPLLAPLPSYPTSSTLSSVAPPQQQQQPPHHLTFILTLHDETHKLRHCTVSQHVPADWLDVAYEESDWVEERLVDVIKTAVEVVVQEVSSDLFSSFILDQRSVLTHCHCCDSILL